MSENQTDIYFDDLSYENGMKFWYATEYTFILGYKNFQSFRKVIDKAHKALMSLGITVHENIVPCMNPDTGDEDFRLSRFACYLIAMNADSKKPEVAKAQAYFASMTQAFEEMLQNPDNIERLVMRDEIKDGNTSLMRAASAAGVSDYARFQNAGYLGLYNMYNWQLAKRRNIDKAKLFDHMGRTELAANLFRITMTEEKIKKEGIKGQSRLEDAHRSIGTQIRSVVKQNTGKMPEDLPVEKRLPEVKKETKKIYKEIKNQDKKSK